MKIIIRTNLRSNGTLQIWRIEEDKVKLMEYKTHISQSRKASLLALEEKIRKYDAKIQRGSRLPN
jgi:hypothetical protein